MIIDFVDNCINELAEMLLNQIYNMQMSIACKKSKFVSLVVKHFNSLEKGADFYRDIIKSKDKKSRRFSSEIENFFTRKYRVQNELTSISVVFDAIHNSVIGLLCQREYSKEFYNCQL